MNFLDGLINEAKKKKKQVQTAVTGRGGLIDDVQGAAGSVARTFTNSNNFQNAQKNLVNTASSQIKRSPVFNIARTGAQAFDNNFGDSGIVRADKAIGAGLARSAVGGGQAFTGLADLLSPGKGTSAYSKMLDQKAKGVDAYVDRNKLSKPVYKAAQFGGDLAQFAAGGAAAKGVTKAAPVIGKIGQPASVIRKPVVNVANNLATKGVGGRIAGNTLKAATDPRLLAANAAQQAFYTGQNASRGQDISPLREAGQFAIGQVGLPLAGAAGREAVAPAIRGLRNNNIIAPTRLNRNEVADLSIYNRSRGGFDMTDNVYQRGQAAAQKANVDIRNPQAVDDLVLSHQNFDRIKQQRLQALDRGVRQVNDTIGAPFERRGVQVGASIKNVKNYADDLSPEQNEFIADYAEMLKTMGQGNGVEITADGRRVSNNFRNAEDTGRRMTNTDWFDRARADIESGKAGFGASDDYAILPQKQLDIPDGFNTVDDTATSSAAKLLPKGQAVPIRRQPVRNADGSLPIKIKGSSPEKQVNVQSFGQGTKVRAYDRGNIGTIIGTNADGSYNVAFRNKQNKLNATKRMRPSEFKAYGSQGNGFNIQGGGREVGIPVSKVETNGQRVTKTNLKTGKETRYALNDVGELMEDTNGAFRIFRNDEGRVTQFRIGDEVHDISELGDLSNLKNFGKATLDQRRNLEGALPGNKEILDFIPGSREQAVTRMTDHAAELNKGLQAIADDLGISFGVGKRNAKKVSAAIQNYGEKAVVNGKVYAEPQLIADFGEVMAGKIIKADQWFRKQYDDLLDQANDQLVKYGYDPIPKRKDYYTHFEEPGFWENVGLKMQNVSNVLNPTLQDAVPSSGRGSIPNNLAGQSEFLQPNKQFNPFALRREGNRRTADAFGAFERYINPTLSNIHLTPEISRSRAVAKVLASEADLDGKDINHVMVQLREHANGLSGKSNRWIDRTASDSMAGRGILAAATWLQRRAGANTIVGNLGTVLVQPIVSSQAIGKFGTKNFMLGAMQEAGVHAKDAPIRQSEFLKRRYTKINRVTRTKTERGSDLANKPLEIVEETVTRTIWNAAHYDALSKGIKGADAIKYADVQTQKTVAGRAVGERPELFTSKSANTVLMYNLEVNNFWQQTRREMTKTQVARTLAAAYVFNLAFQAATGRQIGFNPVQAGIDSYKELGNENHSNVEKAKKITQRNVGEVVDNVPGIGPLASLAIGDKNLRGALGDTSNVGKFGAASPISALVGLKGYAVLPYGGSQVKKTVEGVQAYMNGGIDDKDGNRRVDIAQTPVNFLKAATLGKNSIKEVNVANNNIGKKKEDQQIVPNQTSGSEASNNGSGTKSSSTRLTAADAVKAGMNSKEAKEFLKLSPADQKALAASNPEARALYDQKQNIERTFAAPKLRSQGLSDASTRVLNRYDRLNEQGKKKFDADFNSTYQLKKAQLEDKKLAGGDAYELDRDFIAYDKAKKLGAKTSDDFKAYKDSPLGKFQVADAQYKLDKANGKISSIDDYKKQDELYKLQLQAPFSKEAVEIMGMGEKRILDYLGSSSTPKALKDELLALDAAYTKGGLQKYSKLDGVAGKGGTKKGKKGNGNGLQPSDFKLPSIASQSGGANIARSAGLKGGKRITARNMAVGKAKLESNRVRPRKTLA